MPIIPTVRIIIISDNIYQKDISKDETIVITPRDRCNIKIYHYLSNKKRSDKKSFTSLKLTKTGMYHYLTNLIDFLCMDNEPCNSIQLDFPCVPSIILDISFIKDNRDKVLDIIHNFCRMVEDSWFHETAGDYHYDTNSDTSSEISEVSNETTESSDTEMDDDSSSGSSATSASSDHTPLEKAQLKRTIYNTRSRTKANAQAKAVAQAKGRHHLFLDD